MRKPMFALLVLAIALFGTQCWAQSDFCVDKPNCHEFSPNSTSFTYNNFGDGSSLTVQFVTVLTTFHLAVAESHPSEETVQANLDPNDFPSPSLTRCVPPFDTGKCNQYDFTGDGGGTTGVPVRNTDYKGLITLILSYFYSGPAGDPAFGHAPDDNPTFVDILTGYSTLTVCTDCELAPTPADPTMDGTTPGLSSVIALAKPLTGNDTPCGLTLTPTNNPSGQKPEIEVTLKIVSGSNCSGTGIRDKTARLSVSTFDSGGNFSFPALKNVEGNKFHWNNKNGLNEYDISTEGLVSGQTYTVTVFSSKVSPQSATFVAP